MKRFFTILLILMMVAGVSVAGYYYTLPPAEPVSLTDDPTVEIVNVERETIVETVDATGRIEPQAEVEMKFEIGGGVEEVLVQRGQHVSAGTVLARLQMDTLQFQVRRAEIELTRQQAQLEQLFEPELVESVASAEAQVESARLKLAELLDGPDPDEVTKAAVQFKLTEVALKQAQWDYDQVAYRGDVGAMPQADALQEATLNHESAQADYNLAVKEATPAELAEARASLASAQANLAELLQEPSAADIAAQQAAVETAQLDLEEKQQDLEDAVLVAPTAGVILEMNIEPGERVLEDAGDPVMIIANTDTYLLKMAVDEIDIGQVHVGQPATILLDAFLDQEFEGKVTDIAPRPVENEGNAIVTYEVTISVDTQGKNPGFLPGMTATASIETQRLEDVMVVPNRAIQIDRAGQAPTTYVEKLNGQGAPSRVEVELGSRNGEVTEIIAGVDEGDQIVVRSQPGFGPPPDL